MNCTLLGFVVGSMGLFLGACDKAPKGQADMKESQTDSRSILMFLGAPGSGKGTISEQCVKTLGFATVSTGNLLRDSIARGEELGKKADVFIKKGLLVPDEIVAGMVEKWLADHSFKTLLLDGFPRTAKQAEMLLDILKKNFAGISLRVVRLTISDDSVVSRLSDRLVCSNKACQVPYSKKLMADPTSLVCTSCGGKLVQREDDKEEVIRQRLQTYHENEQGLISVYKAAGIRMDDLSVENKTVDQVFADFKVMLNAK